MKATTPSGAIGAITMVAVLAALSACAPRQNYSATATYARVVDARTGKPIEGVIVIAHWSKECGFPEGNYCGELEVLETVTDENGDFHFPAWGPKHTRATLAYNVPELILFKRGYHYSTMWNHASTTFDTPIRTSQWNGTTVKLERIVGGPRKEAQDLQELDESLNWARYRSDCSWEKIPLMLVAVQRTAADFEKQGYTWKTLGLDSPIRRVTDVEHQDKCGSAAEFFRKYLQ